MCHTLFEDEIYEVLVTKRVCLFPTQRKNLCNERAVVEFSKSSPVVGCFPKLLADGAIIQIGHGSNVAGRLKGKPPARAIFGLRTFASSQHRGFREPFYSCLVFVDQFEAIRRIAHTLG